MMKIITASTRARIAKLIPMLASNVDGEVIATVRALERVLKSKALDFHDMAAALAEPEPDKLHAAYDPPPPRPKQKPKSTDYGKRDPYEMRRLIDLFTEHTEDLSWPVNVLVSRDWEFLRSIGLRLDEGFDLTEKQDIWFSDIVLRVKRSGKLDIDDNPGA